MGCVEEGQPHYNRCFIDFFIGTIFMVTSVLPYISERTVSRIIKAIQTGNDPVAAAQAFERSPVQAIINVVRSYFGYAEIDLYADKCKAAETFAKAVTTAIYQVTHPQQQNGCGESEEFTLENARNQNVTLKLFLNQGIIEAKHGDNLIFSCDYDQSDKLRDGMKASVSRAVAYVQTKLKNEKMIGNDIDVYPLDLKSDFYEHEISLINNPVIRRRAAEIIINQPGSFNPDAVIHAAEYIAAKNEGGTNSVHPIADIVINKKIGADYDVNSAKKFAAYIADSNNYRHFLADKLRQSMLWIVNNHKELASTGIEAAIKYCIVDIAQHLNQFDEIVTDQANEFIQKLFQNDPNAQFATASSTKQQIAKIIVNDPPSFDVGVVINAANYLITESSGTAGEGGENTTKLVNLIVTTILNAEIGIDYDIASAKKFAAYLANPNNHKHFSEAGLRQSMRWIITNHNELADTGITEAIQCCIVDIAQHRHQFDEVVIAKSNEFIQKLFPNTLNVQSGTISSIKQQAIAIVLKNPTAFDKKTIAEYRTHKPEASLLAQQKTEETRQQIANIIVKNPLGFDKEMAINATGYLAIKQNASHFANFIADVVMNKKMDANYDIALANKFAVYITYSGNRQHFSAEVFQQSMLWIINNRDKLADAEVTKAIRFSIAYIGKNRAEFTEDVLTKAESMARETIQKNFRRRLFFRRTTEIPEPEGMVPALRATPGGKAIAYKIKGGKLYPWVAMGFVRQGAAKPSK